MNITINSEVAESGRTNFVKHPVVLLVSDNPLFVNLLQRMLANEKDIELHSCEAPWLATSMANDIHPTVIFLDLDLETPDMDSDNILEEYRNNLATTNTPVIAFSESDDPYDKRRAFESGAGDYLVKIPDGIEVVARIRAQTKTYLMQLKRAQEYLKMKERVERLAPVGL